MPMKIVLVTKNAKNNKISGSTNYK